MWSMQSGATRMPPALWLGTGCPCRQGRAQALRDTWVSLQSPRPIPVLFQGSHSDAGLRRGAPVSVCPSGAPTLLAYQSTHPRAKGPSATVRAPFNQRGGGRDQSIPRPGHPSRDAAPGPNPAPGWMWLRCPAGCSNHTVIWGWRQACTHLIAQPWPMWDVSPQVPPGWGQMARWGAGHCHAQRIQRLH